MKTKFFKDLVEGGAQFMRHDRGNMETAENVLKHIFTLLPTNVRIQEEIRVEGKGLEDTAAGSVHREEVDRIIAKHKQEVADIKEELRALHASEAERLLLLKEVEKLQQDLARRAKEVLELKQGLDEIKKAQEQAAKSQEEWRSARRAEEMVWSNLLSMMAIALLA
jgi:glycerol-3-phosphate dehydrogenase